MALSETRENLQAPDPIQRDHVFSKDAEPRSIGHARPSDPGSVTRFRCADCNGQVEAAGAPRRLGASFRIVRAHAVVRRPIFENLERNRAAAARRGISVLRRPDRDFHFLPGRRA